MKTIKYKNKYLSCIQKQSYKFAVVLVVVSMFASFLNINPTFAYFSDEATIEGNTFTAGTLAFHLNPSADFISTLSKGDSSLPISTTIIKDGTLDFQYTTSTTDMSGDTDLCNYLTVQANLNDSSVYNGILSSFSTTAQNYSDPSAWNFVVTLPSGATDSLQDKTCNFKFTFKGWQENLLSTEGFSDTKQISGSITSGHWAVPINSSVVLNEILPNPEGDDNQQGLQGEWVELYNNGNTSVDLAGWMIKDLAGNTKIISSTNTLNGRTTIGPKGSYLEWVVVFMNDSILNNDGDTVYLKDQANNTIDQYAYGNSGNDSDSDSNSTGGGSNSNPSGSETAGNEGKSDARIPDGTGTWVDPIPTPGTTNELGDVIIPEVDTTEVITSDVQPETTGNATVTTDNDTTFDTGTDTTVDESELTTTEEPATVETTKTDVLAPVITAEPDSIVTPDLTETTEPTTVDTTTVQPPVEIPAVVTPTVDISASE